MVAERLIDRIEEFLLFAEVSMKQLENRVVAPAVAAAPRVLALASVPLPDLPTPLAVVMGMPDLAVVAVVAVAEPVAVPAVVALAVARQRSRRWE